jgi:hypothetical protein|tara:strand:+ start:987 stop:1166 length:180 start_codon:yes stop_codon:yes gene_type:complete
MKIEYLMKCPMCEKEFSGYIYVSERRLLRGKKRVNEVFCSYDCRKEFEYALKHVVGTNR